MSEHLGNFFASALVGEIGSGNNNEFSFFKEDGIVRAEFASERFVVRQWINGFRIDKMKQDPRSFNVAEEFNA